MAVADRIDRIPNPQEPVPSIAWPTVGVFVLAWALFAGSSALYLTDTWPWWATILVNWFSIFLFFTVTHEASHRTASTSQGVNLWLGRISTFFLVPWAGFGLFRFVHMQHHRFTNDPESDPDQYTNAGSGLTTPLRWATIDFNYARFYLQRIGSRPRKEVVEAVVTGLVFLAVLGASIATGNLVELLVVLLIPGRLAIFFLGYAFDYLPHHGLPFPGKVDQTKTTRNRIGMERLLTPLLLYQNYHLVHHLHPIVPFYRYIAVWRRNEEAYLERNPPLSTALGRPLTVEEYRELKALEHH